MFNWINPIETALRPIEGVHHLSLLALPQMKAVWQIVTAEKTQRILQAIALAVWVMGTIVLCGMFEVGRLAVREATIVFRAQLGTTVTESAVAGINRGSEPEVEALISRQTGVRQLRQVAT
jgi:hypothetical protein